MPNTLNMVQAINQALMEEMQIDETIVVYGEDVGVEGGVRFVGVDVDGHAKMSASLAIGEVCGGVLEVGCVCGVAVVVCVSEICSPVVVRNLKLKVFGVGGLHSGCFEEGLVDAKLKSVVCFICFGGTIVRRTSDSGAMEISSAD